MVGPGEPVDLGDERLADRVHECGGHERLAPVLAEEGRHTAFPMEVRHVDVQVHPVDPLHFEIDVGVEDFNHRTRLWYVHCGLRSTTVPRDQLPPRRPHVGSTLSHPVRLDRSPLLQHDGNEVTALHLVGLRRSLVSN
jgi:hypothetical protein